MKNRIKTLFLTAAVITVILQPAAVPAVSAASGPGWEINSGGLLTIENDTGMTDWAVNISITPEDSNNENKEIRDSVKSVVIEYGVTRIPAYSFATLGNLTKVTIPDSVTSIERWSFIACYKLESVTIPGSVKTIVGAFIMCENLVSVTLGDGIETIGGAAFSGCSFEKIIIPDSVKTLGDGAFINCKYLRNITIPDSVTSIGELAFETCIRLNSVKLSSGLTSIPERAFKDCRLLETVTIPDGVTSIGDRAFGGCTNLTSINISDDNAVYTSKDGVLFNKDQTVLIQYPASKPDESYSIPDGVVSLTDCAFEGSKNLAEVTIPYGVTSIDGGFQSCSALTSVTIPNSVKSINKAFTSCKALSSITLPDSITSMKGAFRVCSNLTEVTIPRGVTVIERDTFYFCTSLTSVKLHNGLKTIGESSFIDCGNLTEITFPAGITDIGAWAFYECKGLESITFRGATPPSVDVNAFRSCDKLETVYVPKGAKAAYGAVAPLSGYNIVEADAPLDALGISFKRADGEDYIEISNNTEDKTFTTMGMSLTVDNDPAKSVRLPAFIIRPGQSVKIKGNNDEVTKVLKRAKIGFDISEIEMLFLVDNGGVWVSECFR